MNMRTISALAVLTLAAGGTIASLPSNAVKVPTSVTKVSVTCGTCVAPITCATEDSLCAGLCGHTGPQGVLAGSSGHRVCLGTADAGER